MRGVVVVGLEDYVQNTYSLATWQAILESTGHEDLIITVSDFYPDEAAIAIVAAAAEATDTDLAVFIEDFGKYLFGTLKQYYDFVIAGMDSLDQLLHSLEEVIHPQVKKMHPDAVVPSFRVENKHNGWLVYYKSQRQLYPLAIGLIYGAADHFNESIHIEYANSMMDGHEEYEFHVKRN